MMIAVPPLPKVAWANSVGLCNRQILAAIPVGGEKDLQIQ
jgi:hypothetical protein